MKNILIVSLQFFSLQLLNAQPLYFVECNNSNTLQQNIKLLAHKPIPSFDPGSTFVTRCGNVNDSIKKRLLYLLEPTWTQAEIKRYVDSNILNDEFYKISLPNIAKRKAKDNDSLYNVILDSLLHRYSSKQLSDNIKYGLFNVRNSILYSVAMLYMYEAVPIIRKNMQHYNRDVAELCLARLGDTALQAKILRENVYTPGITNGRAWINNLDVKLARLAFLRHQEGIYEIRNWLDTTITYRFIEGKKSWAAYHVIKGLSLIIENKDFKALIDDDEMDKSFCPCNGAALMRVKQWLIDNKGKYIISKEYCPPCY